jgi:hypothetical protein
MHRGSARLEHVDRPVPPVGSLDDDLGIRSALGDRAGQRDRVVVDAHRVDHLAIRRLPHNHLPSPMQINTDILTSHPDLPPHTSMAYLNTTESGPTGALSRSGDPVPS